jgi:multidrug transporter EmrE-like cation transporter
MPATEDVVRLLASPSHTALGTTEPRAGGDYVNLHWAALALAIGTSMVGQTLLKAGSGAPSFIAQLFDARTIVGFALYAGSALLYIVALRKIPMSVALPCTAVSYVIIALIGHYGFAEPLGLAKIAGIAMICLGVVMLTLV